MFRVQPNCQDVNGETPLHLAALNGHRYVLITTHSHTAQLLLCYCVYHVMVALKMHILFLICDKKQALVLFET